MTITATDDEEEQSTVDFELVVDNVAPVVSLTGPTSADEGQTKTYDFTVTDPGDDTFVVAAGYPDCGTGGNLVAGSLVTDASGGSFDCSFPDGPADPTVSIQVADSDGATSNVYSDNQIIVVAASPFSGALECRAGFGPPQCNAQPFDTSQDLASLVNGAVAAVAKNTIPGYSIHQPQFANDGFYGNGASWIAGASNSWLKIDLGQVRLINRVTLGRDRTGGYDDRDPGQFTIEVALLDNVYANGNDVGDATEYTEVFDSSTAGFSGTINGPETLQASFTPVFARFVKLNVANSGTAIDEMEVFASRSSIPVTVSNVAPTLTSIFQVGTIHEGNDTRIVAQATDPAQSNDPLTFTFDCDDDDTYETAAIPATSAADCFFDDNGIFTVNVRVTDGDGGEDTGSVTDVEVLNRDPTAFLSNDGPVDEGSPATISFGNQFDPSNADTTAGFHYAYDCDGGTLAGANYDNSGTSASTTCTYDDDSTNTVTARIIDKDDGYNEYSTDVVVKNVDPKLTAVADATNISGDIHAVSTDFDDPGILDTHTATIDWGEGAGTTTATVVEQDGSGTVSGSHQYFVPGDYTVEVCVTDKDGGTNCDSHIKTVVRLQIVINNKPGSDPNSVNLNTKQVPVGILSTQAAAGESDRDFDATRIDLSTLVWGTQDNWEFTEGGGGSDVHGQLHVEDTFELDEQTRDGDLDVVVHMSLEGSGVGLDTTETCAWGVTIDGLYFFGCDALRVVQSQDGPNPGKGNGPKKK